MGCVPSVAVFSGFFWQCASESLLRNDGKNAQQREKSVRPQLQYLWSGPETYKQVGHVCGIIRPFQGIMCLYLNLWNFGQQLLDSRKFQ